jgi:hypothetical protein
MIPRERLAGFQTALAESLARVRRHHRAFGQQFPTVGEGSRYRLTENNHWLAGFWTGLLWLAYAATGDEDLRDHAEALLPSFEEWLKNYTHITHDLGFLFTLSARAQWQVTGDRAARQLALRAVQGLLTGKFFSPDEIPGGRAPGISPRTDHKPATVRLAVRLKRLRPSRKSATSATRSTSRWPR